MKFNAKILLFFSLLMGLVLLVVFIVGLYTMREFSLYTAERHARSVAETVIASLTESMVNGTTIKRTQFQERLKEVPGVRRIRIVPAPSVEKQFGQGIGPARVEEKGEVDVLERGEPVMQVTEQDGVLVFRAIIPYIATDTGTPNCLQCHATSKGAVLGAISIDIDVDGVKRQAISTVSLLGLFVFIAVLIALFLLRRLLQPLIETANAVTGAVAQAVGGVFTARIEQRTSDEVGEIAKQLNRLMEFLDVGITTIGRRVSELVGHHYQNTGNQLVTAIEMVEGLVEASHFKQAIEEDQSKLEVYQRLARVLADKYNFRHFSIYEVASSKNRITPIMVDDEPGASCRWCDQQILIDANNCRVKRTGHEVNAVDFPGICTMFRNADDGETRTHICLPITQSGSVGCVVQMVFTPEEAQLVKFMIPFISVYLRETAPVIEAKRLMEHLRESSLRDAMTGLYNRRFLEEYVTTLIAISQRRKSTFAILMLDLDYFKQVNDTFGHEAGDKVLKTLAEILVKSMRAADMVIRYGGEEFLIILMDVTAEAAANVAEKIRAKVEETKISLPGTVLQKTISIGVSEYPSDADTFWQVVKYADVALYEAKNTGRNRVIRFLPSMWKEEKNY